MLTLLDLCINYVAKNINHVDSLIGFPEMIAEKIFKAVKENKILLECHFTDRAKILNLFDAAYGPLILSELLLRNTFVVQDYVDSLVVLHHLRKVDIGGCQLGDSHDLIQSFRLLTQ